MTPPDKVEWLDGCPVALTYNGGNYVILSDRYNTLVKDAIITRDKTPKLDNVSLYKETGITPNMFGLTYSNWQAWIDATSGPEHTGATLSGAEIKSLRAAMREVSNAMRLYAESRYGYGRQAPQRVSMTAQALFSRLGIRPTDLGLSNAESWKVY